MKIAVILGTRPEIIKMSPIIRELEKQQADYFILYTGQHYSYRLYGVFFEQLNLPKPKYNLAVGSGSHGEETGNMLIGIEKILQDEKPDYVLVEGDTNSVLAGALSATKLNIKVGHVEAGLRSYDRKMPEEVNRILVDHCSDLLFAPTENTKLILLREGIAEHKIFVTGNTIVDAVKDNLQLVMKNCGYYKPNEYMLLTLHRQENVDDKDRFASILEGLKKVKAKYGKPIVYPIHPRSRKMIEKFGLTTDFLDVIEPLDYLEFLALENNASLILTDSGGIQEEACILQVPCVTLRDNTERMETVAVGANILVGTNPDTILAGVDTMMQRQKCYANPFGNGKSAIRILGIIRDDCKVREWQRVS